jgi:uncharacterized integral membrane protein
MRPRLIAYAVVVVLLAIVLFANWHLLTSSTQLNLIVGRITAPLIVLLLVVAGLVLAIDAAIHALERRRWWRERHGLDRELEQVRLRADHAEASRVAALQTLVEREIAAIHAQLDHIQAELSQR